MNRVRQLLSWRLFAAVAALAGLALLVNGVLADDEEIVAVEEPTVVERRIDLIAPVFAFERTADFAVGDDGLTVGSLDMVLDAQRTVRIAPGTPGEMACEQLDAVNRCAVFADLLGEAVVWFAVLPQAAGSTVELPPIVELVDGRAVFTNGWRIPYPPVIERECGDLDIPTFADFLRRFGRNSVSIVDLDTQEVVAVRCGQRGGRRSTPTTAVPTTVAPDFGEALDPDVEAPEG